MSKKQQSKELMRLKTVIESDRLSVGSNFDELIVSDLEDLLRDYFELKGRPTLFIAKQGSGYVVNVQAQAIRVKPFGVLPKE